MFIGLPKLGPAAQLPIDARVAYMAEMVRALQPIFRQDQDRAMTSGIEMKRLATENGMDVLAEPKMLSFIITDPQTGASRKVRYSELRAGRTGAGKIQSLLDERRRRDHGE